MTNILRHWAVCALLCLIALGAAAAPAHPHIYFKSGDIPALKARINDPFYADAWNEIKIDVRSSFSTAPATNPSSRDVTGLRSHAAMWLFDPNTVATNPRYASNTLFFSYFNTILNAPGWGDFFGNGQLDSAFYLIGLATGYDWHYDKFSASARADIISKLAARCDYMIDNTANLDIPADLFKPGSEYIHQFKVIRNKFVVQFSALGFVAYALEGEVDETRRQRWLTTANHCLDVWAQTYTDDGVSDESFSYHVLEMECLIQFLEAKSRVTGVNEFLKYPELQNHPYYALYSWVPGGDRSFLCSMPMGDGDPAPPGELRVIDALLGRRLAPLNDLRAGLSNWMQDGVIGTHNDSYYRTEALQFVFADKTVPVTSPQSLNLPTWHYFPDRQVFVWRSGWDNMATYFATNAGRQMGGHMLPEKGNFVIFKGGASYVAHHFYMQNRRSMDFNLLTVDGAGELGEAFSSDSTPPQPPANRANVSALLADNQLFSLVMDLKPIYSSSKLQNYTREFIGFGNKVFVRDKIKTSSSASLKLYTHAYRTTQPPVSDYKALDPDSDPNANPWGGSGKAWTITPRLAGPFTEVMSVNDLSLSNWTGTVTNDVPSLQNGDTRRGSKLERSLTGTDASSLVSYSFLDAGESLTSIPSTMGAEGFRLNGPNGPRAVVAWPMGSYVDTAYGLKVVGAMGGIHIDNNWLWGRSIFELEYNGLRYVSTSTPMSVFLTYSGSTMTAKVQTPVDGWIEIYTPFDVKSVLLNGQPLNDATWDLANNKLRINLTVDPETVTIESSPMTMGAASDTAWLGAAR